MASPHQNSPVRKFGLDPTHLVVGTVYRVYPDIFCVSVSALFESRFFDKIAVASPFLHYEGGAGYTGMPKVGTKVVVAIPGDSSPPFVLACLPQMRPPEGAEKEQNPEDPEVSKRARTPDPSFDNNRPPYLPGDQAMLGPANNGFLSYEMGLSEFRAGSINKVVLSPNGTQQVVYRTQETLWPGGVNTRKSVLQGGVRVFRDTEVFRTHQHERYGTLRIQKGGSGTGEPEDATKSWSGQLGEAGATEEEMVVEVAVIPEGFSTSDGGLVKYTDRNRSLFRLLLNKVGDLLVRVGRSLVVRVLKNLNISVTETVTLRGKKIVIQAAEELVIGSPGGKTVLQGGIIEAGGNARGVFGQGDIAQVTIPPGTGIVGILSGQPFKGTFEIPSPSFPVIMTGAGSPKMRIP